MYSFHLIVINNIFFLSRLSCFEFVNSMLQSVAFILIMIMNLFVNVNFSSYKTKLVKNAKLINFNTMIDLRFWLDSIIKSKFMCHCYKFYCSILTGSFSISLYVSPAVGLTDACVSFNSWSELQRARPLQ